MTLFSSEHKTFSGGIFSPTLMARSDVSKYADSLLRCHNFIVTRFGTLESRKNFDVLFSITDSENDITPCLCGFGDADSMHMTIMAGQHSIGIVDNDSDLYITQLPLLNKGQNTQLNDEWLVNDAHMLQIGDVKYAAYDDGSRFFKISRYTDNRSIAGIGFVLEDVVYTHAPYGNVYDSSISFYKKTDDNGKDIFIDCDNALTPAEKGAGLSRVLHDPAKIYYSSYELHENDVSDIPLWVGNEAYNKDDKVRSGGRVYRAVNTANAGVNVPSHKQGRVVAGKKNVEWEHVHDGYVILQQQDTKEHYSYEGYMPDSIANAFTENEKGLAERASFKFWKPSDFNSLQPQRFCLHKDRFVLVSENGRDLHFSRTGDWFNFYRPLTEGMPDDAMVLQIISTIGIHNIQYIYHVLSLNDVLVVLCKDGEFIISDGGNGLAADSFVVKQIGTKGSHRDVRPCVLNNSVFFAGSEGTTLYSISYKVQRDGRAGYWHIDEASLFIGNYLHAGIKQIISQSLEESLLWVLLHDSTLMALTYQDAHNIVAWHSHDIGDYDIIQMIIYPKDNRLWLLTQKQENTENCYYVMAQDAGRYGVTVNESLDYITSFTPDANDVKKPFKAEIVFLPPLGKNQIALPLGMTYQYIRVFIRMCNTKKVRICAFVEDKKVQTKEFDANADYRIIEMHVTCNKKDYQELWLTFESEGKVEINQIRYDFDVGQ